MQARAISGRVFEGETRDTRRHRHRLLVGLAGGVSGGEDLHRSLLRRRARRQNHASGIGVARQLIHDASVAPGQFLKVQDGRLRRKPRLTGANHPTNAPVIRKLPGRTRRIQRDWAISRKICPCRFRLPTTKARLGQPRYISTEDRVQMLALTDEWPRAPLDIRDDAIAHLGQSSQGGIGQELPTLHRGTKG